MVPDVRSCCQHFLCFILHNQSIQIFLRLVGHHAMSHGKEHRLIMSASEGCTLDDILQGKKRRV